MRIFQPATHGRRTIFVQPGKEFPATHFLDQDGKPTLFSVVFINGEARVDDPLGEYMIDKGLAARSPIILPAGVSV